MGSSSHLSLKRSLLFSTYAALSLFSAVGLAQDDSTTSNGGTATTTAKPTTTGNNQRTTTTSSSSTSTQNLPALSTSTTTQPRLTGLPTLSRTHDNSIPTYPPPSPPPTENAPFMNRSTLPDGTVFIAVGAILGAFGAAVLIWRGIVACLLHRSVERAAMQQHVANDKPTAFPAPPAPFYKYTDQQDSSPSLAVGGTLRGQRRTNPRGRTPSATPSQTNLFFSPTAASGAGGMSNPGNRDSRFLPSGFYAATSASPVNGHGHSISLSNLRPASRGHTMGPTPPESPNLAPRSTPSVPRGNYSTSSISLTRAPSGRAPSAYLDDMLDDQHIQQAGGFPPAGGFPSAGPDPHYREYHNQSRARY